MSFYTDLRDGTKDLLEELGTGVITIKRSLVTLPEPDAAYQAGTDSFTLYYLDACAFGVTSKYVDGTNVLADDIMIIASPIATTNGGEVTIEVLQDDQISIDSIIHKIHKIERVPAAGTAVVFMIFVAR